jgi:hypothetical protein
MDFDIKHFQLPPSQFYDRIKVDKVRTLEDKVLDTSMNFEIAQSQSQRYDQPLYKPQHLTRPRHTKGLTRPRPWIYDRKAEPAK